MRIEITRATVCDGVVVEPGHVVETDERTADLLIHLGKAKPAPESVRAIHRRKGQRAVLESPEREVLE